MRTIPDGFAPSLDGVSTTLCRAWRVTREDGAVLGFTDHDEALEFADTRFAAASGLSAGEAEAALGLGAGTQEVEGAFASDAIREEDVLAGLYDGARVEIFAADWTRQDAHMLLSVATIGEVRWSGAAFTAELRGLEAALDRMRGRIYRRRCDAALGDARCGVDLSRHGRTREGTLLAQADGTLVVGGLGDLDRAAFVGGQVTLPDRPGAPDRDIVAISDGAAAGELRIAPIAPFAFAIETGETVRLTAGCDKSFATCRARFANAANFRGFPHLPGLDEALKVGKEDAVHDGAPVVA